LIEGVSVRSAESAPLEGVPRALTWKGHDFLDLARDPKRWSRAKAVVGQVGSAPVTVWTKVLNDLLVKELGAVS
jgi:hypothetical protein